MGVGRVLSFAAAVLLTGTRVLQAQADEIFVTNDGGNSVSVFARTATGDPPLAGIHPLRDVAKLAISIWMLNAFPRLAIALQAVFHRHQHPPHR